MFEPARKCENAIFKPNNTRKHCITFKMAYSCCFSLGGNQDFHQKILKHELDRGPNTC